MSRSISRRLLRNGVIFTTVSLAASSALSAELIDEVVVTATKRGETALQETPLSITALGGDTLQVMGADSAGDFLRSVPGLVFEEQGLGDKKYVIRGVQSVGAATVAVYFDDIVLTANNRQDGGGRNVDPKLVDIERIEVLRGPQGTLYGASAMTGTVRYIYNKPKLDKYEATVNARLSSTKYGGESYDFDGVLSMPVVQDKLAVRLVGYSRDDAGWIDRPLIGQKDVNYDDTQGLRAHTLWQVSDALSITASFIRQQSDSGGRSAWQMAAANELYEECAVRESCTGEITRSEQEDDWSAYNLTASYDAGFGNFFLTSSYLDRFFSRGLDNTQIISLIRGLRLPDGSWDRFNPRARHMIHQIQDRTLWSSEARFSSGWDGPLQLITGVFYQDEDNNFSSNVGGTDANGNFADAAVRDNSLWRIVDTQTEHSALFGEVSYQLTPALTATIGARYYEFDIEEQPNGVVRCCGGNLPGTGLGPVQTSKDDGVNMKYNLSYNVSDRVMLYAQAAQGFRSGGTNEPPITPTASCANYDSYGSDSLWNYEVGAKTSWLDNRLIVNITPYYIDWADMQTRIYIRDCLSFFIQNSGKAEVKGLEFEAAWQPSSSLYVTVGVGYADAKLSEDAPFQSGPLIDGRKGDEIPNTPDLTSKLGVTYTVPLSRWPAELQLRGDWAYTSSQHTVFRQTDPLYRELDSYNLVNFRVGLVGNAGWRAAVFVNNAFNELAPLARFGSTTPGTGDYLFTHRPREIGLSLSKDFF